jgi:hypothetical protein
MEQKFKQASLPAYRTKPGKNGIKQEFLDWLVSSYLPTTEHYKGKQIDFAQAKCWVLGRENSGQQEVVELRYEQMLEKQAAAQPKSQSDDRAPLTPEQEIWVAIASQLGEVTNFVHLEVLWTHRGWYVRTNIGATLHGSLESVMERLPLSTIQTKFSAYYAECYQLAKRKHPHLVLPESLEPSKRAG